ncbi:MAG: peptidoglycan DD-metalloendopeptidase family protein [Oscillospiraceae bacterium]|nr:peptidoglycan DD-metalloendopeptidase family protein [Oscillospiraceae bacterium]
MLKRILAYVGNCIFVVTGAFFFTFFNVCTTIIKKTSKFLYSRLKQPLYDIWCEILTPIAHAWGYLANIEIKFKKSSKDGKKPSVKGFFTACYRFICGVAHALKFAFSYIAPVVCIIFLISLVKFAGSLKYGVSVNYNGNNLGVVDSEATFNEAQSLVQDKVTYTNSDNAIIAKPTLTVQYITDDTIDADSLSEELINTSGEKVIEAYGLFINDNLLGVYNEEEMLRIKASLEDKLAKFYTAKVLTVEFEDKISITQGRYVETNLTTADEMLTFINGDVLVEAYYVAVRGDSLSLMASKLGCTQQDLLDANDFLYNGVRIGDIVTYYYQEPNLGVLTTHLETYDRVVEFTTQYVDDPLAQKYCEMVTQYGSDGLENVTAIVTERNGKNHDRTIISSYTLEEMTPRIILAGTQENTFFKKNKTTIIDTIGTMIWPVNGGYVSSLYGWRNWDNSHHNGLDIAAPRGTDILAAADGIVTYASTKGTYGKLVVIDHGHGIETYYSHQYAIDVKVGQYVQKGDVIGHVGMTGSASGNHLHFELRQNGVKINPFMGMGGAGNHNIWE